VSAAWRIVIGALLGVAGLWLALRGVPRSALGHVLSAADPVWAGAALGATLLALGAVGVRWRLLLLPAAVPTRVLLRATIVGQMLNILLPLRLGEVARVYAASTHGGVSLATVAASVAVEKGLDLAVFGVASVTLVLSALVPAHLLGAGRYLVLPGVAVTGLLVAVAAGYLKVRPRALVWSIVIFGLSAAANQLLLVAFGLALPLSAGVAILVVLQAGSVPPSLPGRIGIYNYLTVVTLGMYGVDRTVAATYSIALYLIAFVPKLILGGLGAVDPAWRTFGNRAERG
jgi:uncharacterized membrane protein YbhN (UPF0104 family)